MSRHEIVPNGIYLDEETGDIWRKSNDKASWEVNGQVWTPFPEKLKALKTDISSPAVSLADAVEHPFDNTLKLEKIVISSYANAALVIDGLQDQIKKFGNVSVSDLHDMLGIITTYRSSRMGWSNIDGTTITERAGSGYTINLPEPKPL